VLEEWYLIMRMNPSQTIKENHEGYEQLALQAAGLLMAVTSVLEQTKRDETLERVMQDHIQELLLCVIS
jgi:hypothetical protein